MIYAMISHPVEVFIINVTQWWLLWSHPGNRT